MTEEPKITVNHLDMGYGSFILMRDLNCTVNRGDIFIIMGGSIAGFTLANDVSAWDIERENALYLPQSKTYDCCCALGPAMVTADALPDPYALEMSCTIMRAGKELFSGSISTSRLHRRVEYLVQHLTRANHVPCGTVVLTGTGIIVPSEAALAPGDIVTIRVAEIGELTNHAVTVE